jgi:hypothetical protein
MYKKISGVDEQHCRDNIIEARFAYKSYQHSLSAAKLLD